MIYNKEAYELGSKRSAIRELFEYGKKRAAIVGAENVYDFSLGNPTVPAPDCVDETIRQLTKELDCMKLHGYTSAQGDVEFRAAISSTILSRAEENCENSFCAPTYASAASCICSWRLDIVVFSSFDVPSGISTFTTKRIF